jgi:hypothetical protein
MGPPSSYLPTFHYIRTGVIDTRFEVGPTVVHMLNSDMNGHSSGQNSYEYVARIPMIFAD